MSLRSPLAAIALALLAACPAAALAEDLASAEAICDRLAAHPLDETRPSGIAGVEQIAPEDVAEAVTECTAAIEAGSTAPRIAFELGRALEFDDQPAEAAAAYRKAADGGSTLAMVGIAMLYLDGNGVEASVEEARAWLEKAAAAGNPIAMGNLGSFYGAGLLGEPDFAEAREWFARAAAAGYGEAMFQLGLMDADGDGAPADDQSAKSWFEKAAALGVGAAYFSLGEFAEEGRAGPKDLRQAIDLYKKAVDLGDTDAGEALERLRCPFDLKDADGQSAGRICFSPDEE